MEPITTPSKLTAFDFRRIAQECPTTSDAELQFATAHIHYQTELPKYEDLVAFSHWRHSQSQRPSFVPKASDYVEYISKTRYSDPMDIDYLMELLEYRRPRHILIQRPYIHLGEHRGIEYRLKPNPAVLQAKPAPIQLRDDVRTRLPNMLLGLNKTVSDGPMEGETAGLRRDSVLPTGRLNDESGFVLFQLGILEYLDYQDWKRELSDRLPLAMAWKPTNYAVVVQINEKNESEDVWIVCNYKPEKHTPHGHRPAAPKKKEAQDLLPSDKEYGKHRPAARIAKAFKDLRADTTIKFPEPGTIDVLDRFELVPAVLEGDGKDQRIVRQYITEVEPRTTTITTTKEDEELLEQSKEMTLENAKNAVSEKAEDEMNEILRKIW